nr:RNA-directed DNA polymerase, eukaryota [Tanacetum cinerariifolium]
ETSTKSDDPFDLYNLLNKPPATITTEPEPSLSHPPGFTPAPSHQEAQNDKSAQHDVASPGIVYSANESSSDASVPKRVLWDYISGLVNRWDGETIVMGDFNEVRSAGERFGSVFNQASARVFNNFISSSGLIEVKMEGYSFTWSLPSASKMSKLDRFLVSDGIYSKFPSIAATCLKTKKALVDKLVVIDKELDSGNVTDDILLTRLDLTRNLNAIKQADQLEMAQKAKVRWAIEGDENSKYFHVIINKRRAQLAIRGVFSNGTWITKPSLVKKEFVDHFAARFKQPLSSRLKLNLAFPN